MNLEYLNIYNNLIKLTRNKSLYIKLNKNETFSDRIMFFFFHFAFFLKAFKSVLQILVLGFFKLPIRIWLNSKNKLITQYGREESIYEILDDEYIATNWLDWAVDCAIFLIYPVGLLIVIIAMAFTKTFMILIALIPLYFSTIVCFSINMNSLFLLQSKILCCVVFFIEK